MDNQQNRKINIFTAINRSMFIILFVITQLQIVFLYNSVFIYTYNPFGYAITLCSGLIMNNSVLSEIIYNEGYSNLRLKEAVNILKYLNIPSLVLMVLSLLIAKKMTILYTFIWMITDVSGIVGTLIIYRSIEKNSKLLELLKNRPHLQNKNSIIDIIVGLVYLLAPLLVYQYHILLIAFALVFIFSMISALSKILYLRKLWKMK